MNSYGSVSRISEIIYKILRYMNLLSNDNNTSNSTMDAAAVYTANADDTRIPIQPIISEGDCPEVAICSSITSQKCEIARDVNINL
jgi:hypothetical protein